MISIMARIEPARQLDRFTGSTNLAAVAKISLMNAAPLEWCYLGRVDYAVALGLQRRLREAIRYAGRRDVLLLLEHPPVITLGRSAGLEHIRARPEELSARAIEVHRVGRGGEVTLHAPGQLVGYPLRRLRSRSVRAHVTGIVEGLRRYLATSHGLETRWDAATPGLWTLASGAKIAAVGVDARGGVAMHGFALNLRNDMGLFSLIVPCGLERPVTSLARELGTAPGPAQAAPRVAQALAEAFGVDDLIPIDAAELEGEAGPLHPGPGGPDPRGPS